MLTAKPRSPLEGIFAPRSPWEFIGFSTVTGMLGLLSAGNLAGFLFVPAFAIVWWWVDRQRSKRLAQATRFSVTKQPPQPARGLILLLSPYDPRNAALKDPAILNPLIQHVVQAPHPTTADFTAINLLSSNLLPQIKAVEYHVEKGNLRNVWLIASASYESVKGSELAAVILEKYLRLQYGMRSFDIHREGLTVKEYDYAGVWRLGEQIFRQSGYKDEVLVVDVTGGTKMMSVAIAMACISPRRRMQYMDSQRDWQGNPLEQGEMSPVGIDVDPILYAAHGEQ